MSLRRLTLGTIISFALMSLLFQNCSPGNFTSHGNGSPHEGIVPQDPSDPTSGPTTGPATTPLSPENLHQPNTGSNSAFNVEITCFPQGPSPIAEVYFGQHSRKGDQMVVVDSQEKRFFARWIRSQDYHSIQSAISPTAYVINMTQSNNELLIDMFIGVEQSTITFDCHRFD